LVLGKKLAPRQLPGVWNFKVGPEFKKILWTPDLSPIALLPSLSLMSSAYALRIQQSNKVVRLKRGQKVKKGTSKTVRPIAWVP